MSFDYLSSFPLPAHVLPPKLRALLEPVGLSPNQLIEVACMQEINLDGPTAEHLHLQMAVVAGLEGGPIGVLDEAGDGVVQYSVPVGDKYGCSAGFSPSVSGHDYIVAAWGNGSFYTFNLAEKVFMTLGLTPRCVGNDQQRLVYDDLSLPELAVAEGEVSGTHHWHLKRNVCWRISNKYLRRYLWLSGARGIRVFYYSAQLGDDPEIRAIMDGESHISRSPQAGTQWYQLDVQEHKGGLLLQLWASVEAVMPELCEEKTPNGILWPGEGEPMTDARADALVGNHPVYLDDRFLQKYEQNTLYDSTPFHSHGQFYCNPSYRDQWSFTDCKRTGRNLIRISMRELYKPKPDREIMHAWSFAVDITDFSHVDLEEEHVVSKVQRLLFVLLQLGDGLSSLGAIVGRHRSAAKLTGFDRDEIEANGWLAYPSLNRLAQVVPLDMTQQAFVARCKSLHEVWQRIPDGYLKLLLESARCPRSGISELKSIKLLQALMNIVERLNLQEEAGDSFLSHLEPEEWLEQNSGMAPLFLNNDLRIADAHETMNDCLATLEKLGFDIANVNTGYGKAFDFVIDSVIESLGKLATEIGKLVQNK